jgi:hypothetical protein
MENLLQDLLIILILYGDARENPYRCTNVTPPGLDCWAVPGRVPRAVPGLVPVAVLGREPSADMGRATEPGVQGLGKPALYE